MNARSSASGFVAPVLDEAGLERLLTQQGYRAEDRAAVRAFGRVVSRAQLQADFLDGFLARGNAPVSEGLADAEAQFCDELLNICAWRGEPEWFNRLAFKWSQCLDLGVDDDFPWSAAGALIAACRERLVGGRAEIFQLELDLLTGLVRVVWALTAHLSNVALARERARADSAAYAEPGTGLPNRQHFERLLERAVSAASAEKPVGLTLLRVHAGPAGEGLIVEEQESLRRAISERLREVVRDQDVLCATGENEWALVQCRVSSSGQVLLAANKLREVAIGVLARAGKGVSMTALVGGACAPADGQNAAALERAARDALRVGRGARQAVTLFNPDVAKAAEAENQFEREFLRALHLQHFELHLQPQVASSDGACVSAEALLRWQRENGQWVAPPTLIDLAGRLGMSSQLSRMLIARLGRIADELARAKVNVRVMLNLTAEDVRDPELPDLVHQSLANWRVARGRVGFELTEGAVLSDDPVVDAVLSRLREQGAVVSLDDFGTGYSSLAHLRRLPVDELKIDRRFVAGMHAGHRDMAIVEAVLALAQAFGLQTVAEGVEKSAEAETLTRLGCNQLQGFLIARPMPVARFIAWWQARQTAPSAAVE